MDTTDSAYGDKLVRLDTFDTAVAVDPSAEDDAKRRFMTLILQTAHRNNGNIGHVLRATNTSGEVFAVKLLKDNAAYRTKCVSTLGASAQVDAPFSAV